MVKLEEAKGARKTSKAKVEAGSSIEEKHNLIVQMHSEGIKFTTIAKKARVSDLTVVEILQKKNIKQNTSELRQYIEERYNKVTIKDIIVVINVYMKQHEYTALFQFINSLLTFDEMTQIDKQKLQEIKEKIEYSIEVSKLKKYVSNNMPMQDIMRNVRLKESEIMRILNQMKQAKQEDEIDTDSIGK